MVFVVHQNFTCHYSPISKKPLMMELLTVTSSESQVNPMEYKDARHEALGLFIK